MHGGYPEMPGRPKTLWSRRKQLIALSLSGLLLFTTAASGVSGMPKWTRPDTPGASAEAAGVSPQQEWIGAKGSGSSTSRGGGAAQKTNRVIPASQRSRNPEHELSQEAVAPSNVASVQTGPVTKAQGYQAGSSQELSDRRDAYQQVYVNPDGTQTTVFSTARVNYKSAAGKWEPIDARLSGDAVSGWRNTADEVRIGFAGRADARALASFTVAGGQSIAYGLSGAASVAGQSDGSLVAYHNVLPGIDVELQSLPGELKETLVLRSAAAARSYDFPLRLDGLSASLRDGAVVLADASGTPRAVIPPGYVVDATGASATQQQVRYELLTVGGSPVLRMTVDKAWLLDRARVFPVRVDPTVKLPVASDGADSAMYVSGSSSASGSSELRVGTVNGVNTASYIKFAGLVDRLRYHTIFGAQLVVVNYDSDSCSARPVTVHPVTSAWSPGTGYSYPGPSVGGSLARKSFAHGYVAFGESTSRCPAAGEVFDLGGSGADLVQRWVNGDQANYGLSLRALTGASSGKRFAGPSTANPPRLYVTHSPYNASYQISNPVPNPPVLQNQDGRVNVTVTNRSAEAWSAGGYYLAYRAYNARTGAAVGQQRAADLTGSVARGAKVTLSATIKRLPPGRYFLDFTMVRAGGVVFTDHQVAPARMVLEVIDIPPVVQELYPPNGYSAQTLSPQLWARAVDVDAPPGVTLSYKFEVCQQTATGGTTGCFNSGFQAKTAWTVPSGKLTWSKTFVWKVTVKDGSNETPSPQSTLLTAVPQPEITSRIAASASAEQDREFDAQTGNVTTVAMDATVSTVGPDLNLVRTYNSLDPRRDSLFGAGWWTRYDMRVVADDDGSGNVTVTYPDGQQVRFGKNPDGTFAAPAGRTASLTWNGTVWALTDKAKMVYQFSAAGRLVKITDAALRSIVLTYSTTDGKLARARVSNSQTNTAGRSIVFTWSGNHIATVATDPVGGTAPTWTYTYTGDQLTSVCAPGNACTRYAYSAGSHYRSGVLDAKPESYWRLGEAQGTAAASEVAVNLGKDAATYANVTLATAGALTGTQETAAGFNGTSSAVTLPKGALKKSRDGAVELWFKPTATGGGGPLLGYQDKDLSAASTTGVPLLYVGTDGKLYGQFGGTSIAPLASTATVNDGRWHHAVLSIMGGTQTLWLDGAKAAERTGMTVEHSLLTFNQVGAAYATTPASWPGWGSAARRYFTGAIDEVAVYSHPLGLAAVAAHYSYGAGASQLSSITLPSGKVAAEFSYDTAADRVVKHTDRHGGTWQIGAPLVFGGKDDLRRSVQILDPSNRPYLFEYDGMTGQLLRSGSPMGLETREEDLSLPVDPPAEPPTEVCTAPDPSDPSFCTVIPGDAGGPVFVRHPLEGMAIRTFEYDADGNQTVVTNENGDAARMTYDARGNVVSTRTCRTSTVCFTSYSTYPATVTDQFDPRNDLPTETRDARSASATDATYRTTYAYTSFGELATQANPDGSTVSHTYTTGGEAAYGGGSVPAGLLLTTTDARGKITRYAYYQNGDLYRVTQPSGLQTSYTYDALGRTATETEISDAYPSGLVTTYTFDALSRPVTTTEPVTSDAVTGQTHQKKSITTYDADGNVIRVEVDDVAGADATRVSTWEYDDFNHPVRIVDAAGNETVKNYDRYGNETTVVDANGNRYDYAYTARNALSEVRLRDYKGDGGPNVGDYLTLHTYSYDYAGRLASDTDAMGRRLEYEYYGDDLLYRIVMKNLRNADGTTRDYVVEEDTYDGAGNLSRQAAANGTQVTQRTFTKVGNIASLVTDPGGQALTATYTYDLMGNVTRTTSTGRPSNVPWVLATTTEQTDYVYDDTGNAIRQTVTAGSTTRVSTSTYDQRGLLTSTTDPLGRTTTYTNDQLGRRIRAISPSVTVEQDGGAPTTVTPTILTGFNTFDEAVSYRDERSNITRNNYDELGRVVSSVAPSYRAPGALTATESAVTARYDAAGNMLEKIDGLGHATRYTYDQLGRLTATDEPGATDTERAITRRTYTRTGELLSVTGPNGARTEATYDDLDRQVTSTIVERYPTARTLTTRYAFDDAGNVTSITSPSGNVTTNAYDGQGQLIQVTDPSGTKISYGYDNDGRQVRTSDGLGRTERVDYDPLGQVTAESDVAPDGTVLRTQTYTYDAVGNQLSSTSPGGITTTYAYDTLDRLIRQVEPVTDTTSITTGFGYDAAGNQTRYTDGRGNQTYFTYNSLGLLESQIEPATTAHPTATDRTWTLTYDASGQPVRLAAPGGITTTQTYDAAGRVITEAGAGAGTAQQSFGYDIVGRMTQATSAAGTDTYTYDDRGNLLTSAGRGGSASFGYNVDGQLTSRTDAAGASTYAYTKGRLSSTRDGITGTTQNYTYDAAGFLKSIDYGSSRVRSVTYDNFSRVATDTTRNGGGTAVASIAYSYDVDDHLTRKITTGTAGAGDNTYAYDKAGRLTSWTGPQGTVAYAWDASGNRTRAGSKTATYDQRNRLLSDTDYTYTYTARGTLASRTSSGLTESYTFDAFDRLTTAGSQTYTYDALDRVATRNGITFLYAGMGDDVVSDGSGQYARGPSGEVVSVAKGGEEMLAIRDGHGDVVAGIDPDDTTMSRVADSKAYDPFGQVTAKEGDTGDLGFQGDWTDPDTGQVDMGARWYEPGTGAFTSRDTVDYDTGDSILANRYTYGAGDPLANADPDGNWPSCGWCRSVANAVGRTVSHAWSGVKRAASSVWSGVRRIGSYVWSGIRSVASWAGSAIRRAATAVSSAAKWVYHKAKSAVHWVSSKVSTAYHWVSHKVSYAYHRVSSTVRSVASSTAAWARQKAEQARRAVYAAKKRITEKARSVIEYAVKHNPVKVVAAVLKPVVNTIKKVVSAAAHIPAAVVAVVRDVVVDTVKAAKAVYQTAVTAAGAVVQTVSQAAEAVADFAQAAAPYVKTALSVAADAVGVTDLVNCVTKGDLEACAWTAATIAGYALGGAGGGAVRAARAASLVVRHGDDVVDAVKTGSKVFDEVKKVGDDVADLGSCAVGNSFDGATLVRMADGSTKRIDEVDVGDKVLATDPTTGRTGGFAVTHVIVGEGDKDLVEVTVDTSTGTGVAKSDAATATVTATRGHPFWDGEAKRWVEAGDLRPDEGLQTSTGSVATTVGTREWTEHKRVYNLTVDTLHTFFVVLAGLNLLVHNDGAGACPVHQAASLPAALKAKKPGGKCTCFDGPPQVLKRQPVQMATNSTRKSAMDAAEHIADEFAQDAHEYSAYVQHGGNAIDDLVGGQVPIGHSGFEVALVAGMVGARVGIRKVGRLLSRAR
ncbi:LamG-like jellyroll fold domain-containing protein [Hamadaea sp. NPDC051192]|uniref:LamG-like jellyroll fold domain-containing protein n=1 Tax=Hamadaea sp. NPDC051192 TaxID=3154940 RepID=UPI0034199D87